MYKWKLPLLIIQDSRFEKQKGDLTMCPFENSEWVFKLFEYPVNFSWAQHEDERRGFIWSLIWNVFYLANEHFNLLLTI